MPDDETHAAARRRAEWLARLRPVSAWDEWLFYQAVHASVRADRFLDRDRLADGCRPLREAAGRDHAGDRRGDRHVWLRRQRWAESLLARRAGRQRPGVRTGPG